MNKLNYSLETINNKLANSGCMKWDLLLDTTIEEDVNTVSFSPSNMNEYDEIIFQYKFNTNTAWSWGIWAGDNASAAYWLIKLPYGSALSRAGSLHFSNLYLPSAYGNKSSVIKVEGTILNTPNVYIDSSFNLNSSWQFCSSDINIGGGPWSPRTVNYLFDGEHTPALPWEKISLSSFSSDALILAENAQFRIIGGKYE